MTDPIIKEVRRVREELLEQHGGDVQRLIRYLRAKEQQHPDRIVTVPRHPAKEAEERREAHRK